MLHSVLLSLQWLTLSVVILLHVQKGLCAAGGEVIFWVSSEQGTCRWDNGGDVVADERITSNGGACAYQEDTGRVFGCPAPDA